ncbi:MAG TPA: ABC transporter substrate-binding protein [Clostridiales bacterium]|nr:ABC transporter substrate-binding protein [Clostridiales bacterium]
MKSLTKLITVLLVIAMAAALFAGCGQKPAGDPVVPTDKPGTNPTETPVETGEPAEVVPLKWVVVGGGMPENYDQWKANIDPYLAEKIGVNIDVEVVSWGDWGNRRNVIVNSGEPFDILFTNVDTYVSDVNLGAYYDITDLLNQHAPELVAYIPDQYWDASMVNGKIYAVPTYKDSSITQYFVWDKAKAEKYGIDYENIHDVAGLDSALRAIKEGEGSPALLLDANGFNQVMFQYDSGGVGDLPVGVRFDDQNRKVVYTLEQEDVISQLEYIHKWYKEGIINADAAAVSEVPSYRPFFVAQGWSLAAKTVWGPSMGVEAAAIQYGETIVSNDSVRGSLNAVSASSQYPGKALEFLQLVNLDTKVRDAFYYGLEGDNFEYVDGKVKKLNTNWTMAGYTQGTFFTVSQLVDDEFNQWEEVKQLNEKAKPSVLLGFTTDTSSIENEIANCRSVYAKYKSELFTGTKDPKVLIPQLKEELDAAGFGKIIETMQSQIDAAFGG